MLCIKPTQLNHVRHCSTAKKAWNTLKEIYEPSGPARKVTLFSKLLRLRLSDESRMSEHLNTFSETIDLLAEINLKIDELPLLKLLKVKLMEEGARMHERINKMKDMDQGDHAFVARAGVIHQATKVVRKENE